ncbi:hypothetical protein KCP78_19800 [Salmonella enterica subsp. enterica]|nr:hypothetical protein KCP78_19800 [Salmonella enterica subsp. enterica]
MQLDRADRPGMTYVMPSTRRNRLSWAGRRRKPSKVGCEKPFNGISPMRHGWKPRAGWRLSGRTRAETPKRRGSYSGGRNE